MHHACHAFNALKYWVRVVWQDMEQKKRSENKKKTCKAWRGDLPVHPHRPEQGRIVRK